MHLVPDILLFVVTLLGGLLPILTPPLNDQKMHLLLAFSGSFLLGITCLHLLPETFVELPEKAGVYLLFGFFLQLIIQRATHGVEHGHAHFHGDARATIVPILVGLSVHAFMEGMPLGFNYRNAATNPSLYLAVGAHKLPEAMLLGILLNQAFGKSRALVFVLLFSLVTPCSALLASFLGHNFGAMANTVAILVPIVAGAFIHIATTIFFESGTKHHSLTRQKIVAMIFGIGLAAFTLLFE
ncbi:MAG: ZIP family metal transporter [Bacteroidetes bacterium]|nr:ZIP family metal transporter [Bacteroidota bacterium]